MSLERKLKSAIKANDASKIKSVFEEIYYEYGKLVGFIISKYVSNRADIEEIINDVFISFSLRMFKTEIKNIKFYLAVIAKNATLKFIRRQGRFETVEYCEEYGRVNENESLFYDDFLSCAYKNLKENEINILLLHLVHGYTFVEIAQRYNTPVSTVSSIYHRSIKKLRKSLS